MPAMVTTRLQPVWVPIPLQGVRPRSFIFTYEDFLVEYIDVITDFQVGATGDLLDLSDLHEQSIANGFGDSWAGAEFAITMATSALLWMATIPSFRMIRMVCMM